MLKQHFLTTNTYEPNKLLYIFMAVLFGSYCFLLPDYVDPSFISWAKYIHENGLGRIYETGSNYLPVYHYFLWLFGFIQGNTDSLEANLKYIRLFTLFFEFCSVYFVIALVNLNQKRSNHLFYASIILLNIAFVYNTLIFGQIDGLLTTFIFISFYYAIIGRPTLSLIFYVISLNCKFQAILFLPLIALILLPLVAKRSWIGNIRTLIYALFAQILILLPFILSGQLNNVLKVVTEGTVNFYPYLAPSANSFWRWFIPGNQAINNEVLINGETVHMLDTQLFMGITYRMWGLFLFGFFSFIALYPLLERAIAYVFKKRRFEVREHIPEILIIAALLNLCFYFFNTQMHSRYSHYALIFIATYAIIKRDYFIYIFFSVVQFLSLEHDLRFFNLGIYDTLIFNAYFITACYLVTILILFYKLYKDAKLLTLGKVRYAITSSQAYKELSGTPAIIYFSFAILFITWVLTTFRNVVHMDMIYIINTKIKDLYENNLQVADFIYQPMFPCLTSIIFTFLNSKLLHLNTVVEAIFGSFFLTFLGFKYLKEMQLFLSTKRNKILFAFLVGFILFGLHKWEASFTSFFSFAVFFDLFLCIFNYFFIIKYLGQGSYKRGNIALIVCLNLLIILEAPAYFYAYVLSIFILLFLIRRYRVLEADMKRWNTIFILYAVLLILAVGMSTFLSQHPLFQHYTASLSITDFFRVFFQKPLWIIKFYLIAHSGPYLGEADSHIGFRALFGLFILGAYAFAIYYVVKNKDKRLLVPVALIFYNVISYGFITMSRYIFNTLEYGASSRYTAYNVCGVLGLTTILFFFILESRRPVHRYFSSVALTFIIIGYLYVDVKQLKISPYRTAAFEQMQRSVLTGENLAVLQADSTVSLGAIEVLKKYQLNAYYEKGDQVKLESVSLEKVKNITLASGTPDFEEVPKNGFYGNENGITWTSGNASLTFKNAVEIKDSLTVELKTFMPSVCKNINPEIALFDGGDRNFRPIASKRENDTFIYTFHFDSLTTLNTINILSDTIDASPDVRVLSFPFISLTLKK